MSQGEVLYLSDIGKDMPPRCSSSPVCKGPAPSLDKIQRIDRRPAPHAILRPNPLQSIDQESFSKLSTSFNQHVHTVFPVSHSPKPPCHHHHPLAVPPLLKNSMRTSCPSAAWITSPRSIETSFAVRNPKGLRVGNPLDHHGSYVS